jgi:hypothetical protein
LFSGIVLILCFLHGVLKIRDRCRGPLRKEVLDRVWHCYQATTRRQFSQRLRRLVEWADKELQGPVLARLCTKMKCEKDNAPIRK